MREIILTKGKVALVDDADFDYLNQWKWTASWGSRARKWYALRRVVINGKSVCIRLHRCIMGLDPSIAVDCRVVDHVDGDSLNNQRSNLEVTTQEGNMARVPGWKKKPVVCSL